MKEDSRRTSRIRKLARGFIAGKDPGPGVTRRRFLGTSAAVAGAAGLAQVSLAAGSTGARRRNGRDAVVSVYLRGAMDGLSAVVPYGDPDYASERGSLRVRAPGPSSDQAIDLDGFFGLNPAGAPLLTPFGNGDLLFVHASGLATPNRSHFEAQRHMETGSPDTGGTALGTGWIGRHLQTQPAFGNSGLRGIGIGNLLPRTLVGAPETLPVRKLAGFKFPGRSATRADRRAILEQQYSSASGTLPASASASLVAIDLLEAVDYANYVPAAGAVYPNTSYGEALSQVAALLKAGIDLETAQVNLGGWDHHSDLGPITGRFADLFQEFSAGLEAFYRDLENSPAAYTLVAQTEFGRRVRPNGSDGTDHGFGSCMVLMGQSVNGGSVLTQWPGLAPESSSGPGDQINGDLAATIDWRDIAAEVLELRAGGTDLGAVFPGFTPTFRGAVT